MNEKVVHQRHVFVTCSFMVVIIDVNDVVFTIIEKTRIASFEH